MALNLQLFRNAILFASRELARKGLEAELAKSADGEIVLARYGTSVADAKTIFGIAYNTSGVETNSSYTIFDLEDIKATSGITGGKFNSVVGQVEGKTITFTVISKDITVGTGYTPVVLGTVPTGGTLNGIATTDTIQSALHKIEENIKVLATSVRDEKARAEKAEGEIKALVGTEKVETQITNKINTLKSTSSGSGTFVTGVSQTNGIVSVTKGQGKASDVTVDAATAGIQSTTVQGALKELKDSIAGQTASSKVTLESATPSDVAKRYTLKQGGVAVGTIDIPKDMVVQSGAIVKGTWDEGRSKFTPSESGSDIALKLTIGNGNPVYVDVKQLANTYTGKDGIFVSNLNEISIKIDPTTEKYITTSSAGLKLSGVDTAITTKVTTAINALDVADTAVDGQYVSSVSQTDGKIKVTRVALPVVGTDTKSGTSSDKHVKVDVTTTKGVVTAVAVTGTDIASAAKLTTIEGAYFAKANVSTAMPSDGVGVDTKVMSEKLVVAELKKKQAAGDYATKADLSKKQDTLVSGTNIKTINGTSLLGNGNIDTPKTAVVNDLTTGGADKALSAEQGKVLKGLVDGKINSANVVQGTGDSITQIMSQKAVTDNLNKKLDKTGPIDCGTY